MNKLNFLMLFVLTAVFAITVSAQSKGKPTTSNPCPADITNLRATFRDAEGDRYRSDGGYYQTQKVKGNNIEVMFQRANCSYDFTMNLYYTRRTAKITLDTPLDGTTAHAASADSEFFNFDRVASVPLTNNDANFWAFCGGALYTPNVVVLDAANGTYKYDNYAGCGQDSDGRYYVRRVVGIQAGDYGAIRFQNTLLNDNNGLGAGTSYIRVYHPTVNTWELSPEVSPDSSKGALIRDNAVQGYYSVPFAITVTTVL